MTAKPPAFDKATGKLGVLRQFAGLPADTLRQLDAICHLRRYEAGQILVADGGRCEYVGFVTWGFLRMQKTLADGRQHIVGLLVEGDMFGHVFSGPMHFAIEAATEAQVCALQRAPFEALVQGAPELERIVMLNILNELDRARDWMLVLSGQKVSAKIAGFLLVMCSRFSDVDHILTKGREGLEVRVPISRIDLAHLLGTRPESISRAFHALEDAGEIRILKPDVVVIENLEALAERAGDDDALTSPAMRGLVQFVNRRI